MSTPLPVPSNSMRLRGLDALRGIACLAIVLYHATDRTAVPAGLLHYPVRAVLLAKDKQIEPIDLPFDNGTLPEGTSSNVTWDVPPNMTLEDIERLVIERTLQRTGGNKQAAANLLGIYRPRLYSKIRKYNIDVPSLVSA